jgi:chemotaxis protein methyltransferase CheR
VDPVTEDAKHSGLSIDRPALELLAALLLERAGLKITPDGYYGLRLALQSRMPALGIADAQEYVRRLRHVTGEPELRALLPLVTVGKTEFFRDSRQFSALQDELIPKLISKSRRTGHKVKMWSAGCATGEEPYSLAMVASELGAAPDEIDIWATDLNPAAVEAAAAGIFPVRRMVGVSEERIGRFFKFSDAGYEVQPFLKQMIRFDGHNLAAPVFPMVHPGSMDLILCRNVIIYMDHPTILALMTRFANALSYDGVLFLGYSESLFRMSTGLEMFELSNTFAYRRARPKPEPLARPMPPLGLYDPKAKQQTPRPYPSVPVPSASAPRPSQPVPPKASAPIPSAPAPAASAPRPSAPKPPVLDDVHRSPEERLEEVTKLVERGDFPRALLAARRLVDSLPEDLAGQLTLGNIHALMGNLENARESFTRILQKEPLTVEARLYLAVAELQAGQLDAAKVELGRALFLDPTLTLGHYLLGQVLERKSDGEGARRAYRNAIAQRRAPSHVLVGHFPDLPKSNEAIAQAAQYRLAALSEA